MAKEDKQNFMSRLVQGWQNFFNGKQEQHALKPFPKNHFFSPEELDFLSNSSDKLSPIEQWAVSSGRWGYERSKDTTSLPFSSFAPVQWQDGLMATWIEGTLVPDSSERQAEKLLLLQNQSYEIPQRFKSLINNYEGKKLVGTYHSSVNGNEVIKVESYAPGHLVGEEASLKIKRWDKQTLAVTEEEISYSHFSDVLAKGLVGMSDSEKEGFTNLLDRQEKGKKEFEKLLATIKATYPPYMGGSIAPELRKVHDIEGSEDKMIPISWSMGADQSIVIHASTKDSQQKSIHVDGSSAYRYAGLISTVHAMAEGEMNKGYIRSLAKVMGVDFGENVLYAKKNNEPFLSTKEGEVNALIVTSTDFLGITKNSQEKVSLGKTEQRDLKQFLLLEGLQEHTRLCNKVGVSMMKDYVNSLKDKEDITSGDYELLPSHTKVDKLYGEYWSKEEELHDYTPSSLVDREDRAALLADATTSFMSFKQELTKMVEAYNSQSSPISVDDIKKLKSLNAILSQKKGIGLPATINMSIDELEKRQVKAVEKKSKTKAYYISLEENGEDGRWHRPEIEERKAYNLYGNMLSDRLSLQMTYAELPWINAQRMQPCNLSKQPYEGIHGLMLALDVEKNGYALPIYITKEAAKEKGLLVKSDAISFPLVASLGVKEVYNIEQTDYPIKHAKEYETLKLEGISASRQLSPQATLHLLREKGAWPSQILYDGKQDLVSYSYADNSIHLAPAEKYPTPDNFQRDLSQGLIRSTRKVEARSTKYESMVKEELVSLIGSAMIGQKEHFCVTTPQQSSLWKQRLKEDTSYTKEVLRGAENASHLIYKRINEIKRSASQDLDLRTTTPISVDVDGNGIIESQENYAADKKQGSNESLDSPSDDIPRQEKKHWHR